MNSRRTLLACLAVLTLSLAGCADDEADEAGVSVVATTTIWGSITEQIVACAGTGESSTLMPVGADPHDYSASSSDVAAMVRAELVVANGLGLEEGLASALESARADGANVLEVAPLLDLIPFGSEADDSGADPHVWQDMARAATAAAFIGDELAAVTADQAFADCGRQVADDIADTEQQLIETLSVIPAQDRILVTDHDALGYFAHAYGFDIAGVVIPGGSTLAQPSSADLAALTATIEQTGVPAIFANTANPTGVIDAVADEVGAIEVVPLHVDSIGEPGTAADTYQGMMLSNATAIAGALG